MTQLADLCKQQQNNFNEKKLSINSSIILNEPQINITNSKIKKTSLKSTINK